MSTIERAAKRLQELKHAGVDIPWAAAGIDAGAVEESLQANNGSAAGALAVAQQVVQSRPAGANVAAEVGVAEAPAAKRPAPAARPFPEVQLDLERLESAGYLTPTMARSRLADELRHVKRALLKNVSREAGNQKDRTRFMVVTSALPGEGKTFCSINLAISIAMEVDTSVLLVDADVLRPAVLGRLGQQPRKGFLDVLTEPGLDLSDVILKTNIPKLSLLPTGTLNNRSTELLASAAMEDLLSQLTARYADRVVIFDAPPLLLTPSAVTLASRAGQVVMVVEASRTPRRTVAEAFAAVEQCPIVMSVLNKCTDPVSRQGYGYYYG